jgi:transcriptional regulator with XRE-family HTH domain
MRSFQNIATLIRTKRINHLKKYSQSEVSAVLGYKNGQFISNVERGLCSIPLEVMKKVSDILDISEEEMTGAILKDYQATLSQYFNKDLEKKEEIHLSLVA